MNDDQAIAFAKEWEPVEIAGGEVPWCKIELEDGTVLQIRANISGVCRHRWKTDPSGLPAYSVLSGAEGPMTVQAFRRKKK